MIRTRVSAAAAVLALVAASVFLGAVAAQAEVIDAPVITTADGNRTDTTPFIDGTVDNPNSRDLTVQVSVSNSNGTSAYCQFAIPYFSATEDEPWTCDGAALPFGENTFTAVVWEDFEPLAVSSVSNSAVVTIGGTQGVVLVSPLPGAVTADATPAFSGTGPSLGYVDVLDGGNLYCTAAVDIAGNWACDAVQPRTAGVYSVQAAPYLITGSPNGPNAPQPLEIVAPPAPTVDQQFSPWATSELDRAMEGTKDADVNYIQVYVSPDGVTWTPYCQTSGSQAALGSTLWNCTFPFGSLTLGTNFVAAIGFNEANDASAQGASITIDRVVAPTLSAPANGLYTSDSTPTFSGSAPSGTTFTVWNTDDEGVFCSGPIVAGAFSCTPAPLPDGVYGAFAQANPGESVVSNTRTFTIDTTDPDAPVITSPTTTTSTHPTIVGTAEPFATIALYRYGAPAACLGGAVVANSAGNWSCATTALLTVGSTYGFSAVQTDRAGNASHPGVPSPQRYITVVAPPTDIPTLAIAEPWTFDFGLDGTEFEPGDTTRVTGAALPPGANVDIEFHSDPVLLGTTVVEPDGTFGMVVTIPEDADEGEHHFVVVVTPADAPASVQQQAVTVLAPVVEPVEPPTEETTEVIDGAGGSGDRGDPAAPSSLTTSLDTLADIFRNPILIAGAGLAGLALLLFVAFPAELLNATLSEQYSRFSRRVPKTPWLERFTNWLERVPLFGALAITVVTAVVFGFADPGFGFDVTSMRVVLACAIALFIVGYLASWLSGRIIGRQWQLGNVIEIKPLGIILAIVGVALSRVLEFSPGFLIGLLIGIGLVGRTTAAQQAKATLVQAGVVFGLALLGWVGYSILSATTAPDSFATALAFDTMVAVTTEGLTALFIGLLPFKFLDGAALFAHSKVVWAAAYAVVAASFVLIVIPSAWGDPGGSLWLWVAVVGGFAVVAVGVYLYFRFLAKPIDDDDEDAEEPVLEGVR
jgi:hypothetical protein